MPQTSTTAQKIFIRQKLTSATSLKRLLQAASEHLMTLASGSSSHGFGGSLAAGGAWSSAIATAASSTAPAPLPPALDSSLLAQPWAGFAVGSTVGGAAESAAAPAPCVSLR